MQLHCLEAVFKKNNFEVTTAINGHEAFEHFKRPNQIYDLIVLDLNMPISDGFETC
jgi:DNA-binding response OmpR family regulator